MLSVSFKNWWSDFRNHTDSANLCGNPRHASGMYDFGAFIFRWFRDCQWCGFSFPCVGRRYEGSRYGTFLTWTGSTGNVPFMEVLYQGYAMDAQKRKVRF